MSNLQLALALAESMDALTEQVGAFSYMLTLQTPAYAHLLTRDIRTLTNILVHPHPFNPLIIYISDISVPTRVDRQGSSIGFSWLQRCKLKLDKHPPPDYYTLK